MARKKSLWSELQRQRERRARAARAQERANQQLVRQMVQDAERAEWRAERAGVAERRCQEQLAHEAGAAAAKEMKAQLDAQVLELKTLLTSALASPPQLPFGELKRSAVAAPFDPGELGQPLPVPAWEDFAPPAPGALAGLVGGNARHARAQETARAAFEQAIAEHGLAEKARVSGNCSRHARRTTERSGTSKRRLASTTRPSMSWKATSGLGCLRR